MTEIKDARNFPRFLKSLRSPWTVFLIALVIRLVFLWIPPSRTHAFNLDGPPLGLEASNIAYSLAAHQGFASPFLGMSGPTGPTAWLTPVFPWLLSVIVRIFGPHTYASLLAVLILNESLSAATCLPLFYLARKVGGDGLASLTAWLWAILPLAVCVPYWAVWYIPLSALLLAVLILATLAVRLSNQPSGWFGYGLLWGAQLMTNPSFATMIPFVFLWLGWELRKQRRPWLRLPVYAAIGLILTCTPWTVRNFVVFHTFVPLRSNFGLELWRFNNPAAGLHPTNSSDELAKYSQMGEIAYMKEKKTKAIQFIRAHPGEFLYACKKRILYFWIRGRKDGPFLAYTNLGFVMLLPLGLFFMARKNLSHFMLFAMFPIIFPLIYYVTLASVTYRHAIEPILTVIAAVGLEGIFSFCLRFFPRAAPPREAIS
jgi:Dolichyl-phosphate-mannose-protein mannosyltransferase